MTRRAYKLDGVDVKQFGGQGTLTMASIEQDEPTIKVDVSLVNILFNVRDKRGGLVGSLVKSDF